MTHRQTENILSVEIFLRINFTPISIVLVQANCFILIFELQCYFIVYISLERDLGDCNN